MFLVFLWIVVNFCFSIFAYHSKIGTKVLLFSHIYKKKSSKHRFEPFSLPITDIQYPIPVTQVNYSAATSASAAAASCAASTAAAASASAASWRFFATSAALALLVSTS